MKKIIIILIVVLVGSLAPIQSVEATVSHYYQYLTPEEFYQKQKAYITKEANLTDSEATAFFKLYQRLQEDKRDNNHRISDQMKKLNDDMPDKEYNDILDEVYRLRKANSDLDLEYYQAYKKIMPSKKIYKVMRAESKFRREIIRGMNQKRKRGR